MGQCVSKDHSRCFRHAGFISASIQEESTTDEVPDGYTPYPDSRRSSVSTPTLTPSSTSMTTSQQEKKKRFRLQSDLIESRSANPNEDNTEMPPVIVNHAIKACRDSRSFLEAEPYSDFIQKSLDSKKTAISYYEKTGRNDRLFYPNFKCEYVM